MEEYERILMDCQALIDKQCLQLEIYKQGLIQKQLRMRIAKVRKAQIPMVLIVVAALFVSFPLSVILVCMMVLLEVKVQDYKILLKNATLTLNAIGG